MRIAVVVDSSRELGAGHVMRCLALSDAIKATIHANITFFCRSMAGSLVDVIRSRGYTVEVFHDDFVGLSRLADMFIVDRKDTVRDQELSLFNAGRVTILDDVPDRSHVAHALINGNPCAERDPYDGLVNSDCKLLVGPQCNLFGDGFVAAAQAPIRERTSVRRIVVCFGGSDPRGDTPKALSELPKLAGVEVHVVLGPGSLDHTWAGQLDTIYPGVILHRSPANLAEILAESDLAIGAGGCMLWERALLGLPSIVVAAAENQVRISQLAQDQGVCVFLGRSAEVESGEIGNAVADFVAAPNRLVAMSSAARQFMSGWSPKIMEEMVRMVIGH